MQETTERRTDLAVLSSGIEVDLRRPDVQACKTPDDAWDLLQLLEENIIDIEYQIGCYESAVDLKGNPSGPSTPTLRHWYIRAKASLARARLWKADAQRKLQDLTKAEKALQQRGIERAFVDVARITLPEDEFQRLLRLASISEGQKVNSAPGGSKNGSIETRSVTHKSK